MIGMAMIRAMGTDQDALQGDGAEGPDHEQRAVGEVDHAQRAEDQRQAQSDQGICRSLVQAV
jgi:hypothetical protein